MEKIGHLTRYLGFEQSSSRLIFWDLILFYWLSADRSINDTKFPNSPNVQGPSSGHLFQWNTIKNPPRRSQKRAPFRILYVLVLRYLNIIFFRCFEHCVRYIQLGLFRPWLFRLIKQLEDFCHIETIDMDMNFPQSLQRPIEKHY